MAPPETRGPVVTDAGPLIHLAELGCLDLLDAFGVIVIPDAVWGEVLLHRADALGGALRCDRRKPRYPPLPAVATLAGVLALGEGELQALMLAGEMSASMVLTDDAAARLAASQFGYEVHGTIGVLVRAVRRGQRSTKQVLDLLASLPERSSLYVRRALLDEIIEMLKASSATPPA